MLKNFVVLLLPFILVSCFDSDTENGDNGHTTGGIITTYRQISDQNIKTSSYWYTGVLVSELDSLYYTEELDFDTVGFNTPYLEMNGLNRIWYREFNIQERIKSKAVSGSAVDELYIDTVYASNNSDKVFDTIRISLSNDSLYEEYTRSYWMDTLSTSFVGIKKRGVRTYVLDEEVNIREMWQGGLALDSAEPDSDENPITDVPVNRDLNSDSFETSSIFSLSKNDTDIFKIPCVSGKTSLVYIQTNMKTTMVAINGVDQLNQITVNPPQEGFELLSLYEASADGFYNLSLYGNEGLYQLLIVEVE